MAEHISEEDNDAMSEEYQRPVQYCDPCKDDGKQLTAVGFCVDCNDYLCKVCHNAHKISKPSRNHVIKDKNSIPRSKPRTLNMLEMCNEHKNESVKWYCQSHDQVGCDVCKQIDHRNCKEVKAISEISLNISSSDKVKQVKARLVQMQNLFRESLREIAENTEAVEICYTAAIKEITRHLSVIRSRDLEVMKALELTCDTSITTVTAMLDELETLTEKGEEEQIFLATRKVESQLQSVNERLASVGDDNKITRYTYVQESLSNVPGHSSCTNRVIGTIIEKNDEIIKEKLYDINVKTPSDTSACWIKCMDTLSDNIFVAADGTNNKVKLVDIKNKTVISELKLNISPWDLAKIDDKRIAVTTNSQNHIVIIAISNTLAVQNVIENTDFKYSRGVLCNAQSLVVSFSDPNQIRILELDGTLKHIIEHKNGEDIVKNGYISYIAQSPDTGTLYLSDNSQNKIHSMTLDGKILSSYTHEHLKGPRGITADKGDRVFVCCEDSNKIFEISSDLTKGQIIFDEKDGISKPFSILYNKHKLFVGCRIEDSVHVFMV